MENIVYQLLFILCLPDELNFTQLIVVTFTTVWPVARSSQQGGCKNHKGGTFLKYDIECMQQPQRKVACDM